jgi:type VI secretion system protein ImpC
MAYFVHTDADGDQVALPCTERLYSEREAVQVARYRVMPVLSLRGRPEVRLGGFTSLAGGTLAGFWAPADTARGPAAGACPATAVPSPAPAAASPAAAQSSPAPAASPPAAAEPPSSWPGSTRPSTHEPVGVDGRVKPGHDEEGAGDSTAGDAPAALDELDSLLASLNAEPPPAAADAPDSELDDLLAALK